MTGIPAYCPHCGAVFESGFPMPQRGRHIVYAYNSQTCPHCRKPAAVANVFFDAPDGQPPRIIITGIPREALIAFAKLLRLRYQNLLTAEAFEQEATKIDAQLGEAARTINKAPLWKTVILGVLAALCVGGIKLDFKIDIAEIIKALMNSKPSEIINRTIPGEE